MAALPISSPASISPLLEMGAYEALWMEPGASFKTIADKFRAAPGTIPSELVFPEVAKQFARQALALLQRHGVNQFGVRVHGAGEYPDKLRDAAHPVELLYYQGWWNLVEARSVAVVGTRKPSPAGEARAAKMVKMLVADGFTVVSGLAKGIDAAAHTAALDARGTTIAVIGTPLCEFYPYENRPLQERLARDYLVVSQVPICRYHSQGPRQNRLFFPERNVTMSALTEGTIIIEAGETSGTLIQARAALKQGRKLFILDSCFQDPRLTWPKRFAEQGAIRVRDYGDVRRQLAP
jgi:DNA processing protein